MMGVKRLLNRISRLITMSTRSDPESTEILETESIQLEVDHAEEPYQQRNPIREAPNVNHPMDISGTHLIHHRQETRSVSHLRYQYFKEFIDRSAQEHERAMASEPLIPITTSTGRRRHLYEQYKLKVPVSALVEKLEHKEDAWYRWKRDHWKMIAGLRLMKKKGLREWEWTFGEPEETEEVVRPKANMADPNPDKLTTRKSEDQRTINSESCQPLTYAERVRTFTYTLGDDPMWKGNRYYIVRGRLIGGRDGDFAGLMSMEDQEYVPMVGNDIDPNKKPRSCRYVYEDKVEQEHQMALTATEYLFNGVGRAEAKVMRLDIESNSGVSRTAEGQAMPETEASRAEVEGEGAQHFTRGRLSSSSGCSVMSDCSNEG